MVKIDTTYYKLNPWVSLLRIFMCFVVIRDHFGTNGDTLAQKIVAQFELLAVPCFMFLSFYFMGEDIKLLKIEKIKNRLLRLYIPIFVWNIIYWVCKNLFYLIYNKKEQIIGINGLIEGLLFGHYSGLAFQLWFLFVQIIILLIVCIILSYVQNDKGKNYILLIMLLLCYIIEYMKINNELFDSSAYAIKYPMGRIIECIPYAIIGILYSWNFKEKHIICQICFLLFCTVATIISRFYIPAPSGFGYSGVYLLFSSTAICVFSFILPNVFFRGRILINYVGTCTMGIYCLHVLIGQWAVAESSSINILKNILFVNTLIFDAIIFVTCLVITIFIRYLNRKLKWSWIKYSV